ncbi:HTH-type transcriptional repressor YtrA [Roseimaritima multifibrata]|uniref:HTH-type transcriptional repressor YtrA n=1 Tax=Roseimaritima multifibrata TaxID=1930274 RepID=A0A517MMA8_9BACT|nr:GntR family transcriptional regulator [Roseimaritima multifibrata]QDS96009.1 HTH-type transcriptional repressor YtrA [Roseimaritima multifibrata]
MLLHISSEGLPIYQQIVEQIRFRIVSGQLKVGDEMPTIRGLAESLRVNPNTVARAYRELEHESLIEKRRTTGTFVAELPRQFSLAQRRKLLSPDIDRLLITARQLDIDWDDLINLLQKRYGELANPKEQS